MRLTPSEHAAIIEEIRNKMPAAAVYLYGSRTQDTLKGGDIDLLAIGPQVQYMDRIDILLAVKARIGEQRIDLKMATPEQAQRDAFIQSILPTAVRL